jgi:hypothetical protein
MRTSAPLHLEGHIAKLGRNEDWWGHCTAIQDRRLKGTNAANYN